jgi:hypothetical protein
MDPKGSLLSSQKLSTCTYPVKSPNPISTRSILCYLSTYIFVFLVVSFHLVFLPVTYMWSACSAHPIFLDLIILIVLGKEYKSCSSSLWSFLHPPITSSLFSPNTFLSSLFSNTFSLCSSLTLRDQFSHPCRTTGKIVALYIF